MSAIINDYLDNVQASLNLDNSSKSEVIRELKAHIEDKIQDLKETGLHEEEAISTCIRLLGSAKSLAQQIYEAHSQGSWRQALFAALPHALFGLVFALNWWRGIFWPLVILILILSTTVYGWWRGKSDWLFPWLGYSLLPVITAGLLLLYLPRGWSWLAILVYLPLTLWLILRIVSNTLKKDWLYLSLMLLPMPIILSWFIIAGFDGAFDSFSTERLSYFASSIGLSFLALALAVIIFIRIRKRWLKIAVLSITGITTLNLMAIFSRGRLEVVQLLLLLIFTASIFLIPAFLENGARSGRWGKIFEHRPMN
jgi:hypothetical protein